MGIVLKRFPRLSETFILNEIRGLERLGLDLHIFSLLPPEPGPVHAAVAEVRAPVVYFPTTLLAGALAIFACHLKLLRAAPHGYWSGLRMALGWAVLSRRPLAVVKQFWRAGFIATGCRDAGIVHLHAHFAHQPAAVAALISNMTGIPFSFTAHAKDLYLESRASIRHRAARATFIATCTRYNVRYLSDILPPEAAKKIRVAHHGIDLAAFASPPSTARIDRKRRHIPLILSVGRLVPKKGFSDLIAACALLRDRGVPYECTIVGAGPLHGALLKQIDHLGLTGRVHLIGAMAHDRLLSLYREARVFALAPRVAENGDRDGIPNVLVEAMATGVPVVTTNVSGIPELVEHERNGLLVEPHRPHELAGAIRRLLDDAAAAALLADAAARTVAADFDCWKNVHDIAGLLGHQTKIGSSPQRDLAHAAGAANSQGRHALGDSA